MTAGQGATGRRRFRAETPGVGRARAAGGTTERPLPGGPDALALTTAFPHQGQTTLQRTRAPLPETPWQGFGQGTSTPDDRFFVRWHRRVIPGAVDVAGLRTAVRGHVDAERSLAPKDLLAMPRAELAAVRH